jgi:hypothetical protein
MRVSDQATTLAAIDQSEFAEQREGSVTHCIDGPLGHE